MPTIPAPHPSEGGGGDQLSTESKSMKKVEVVETKTYNVNLTPEEARAIIVLDSYTLNGPLRELADALQNYEGEPNGGELRFDIYNEYYGKVRLSNEQNVVIDFADEWEDWGY